MQERKNIDVFVISDTTGRTAQSVIRAVPVQFPEIKPRLHTFSNVRTAERVSEILREANSGDGIVNYSLVSKELRRFIRGEGKKSRKRSQGSFYLSQSSQRLGVIELNP